MDLAEYVIKNNISENNDRMCKQKQETPTSTTMARL